MQRIRIFRKSTWESSSSRPSTSGSSNSSGDSSNNSASSSENSDPSDVVNVNSDSRKRARDGKSRRRRLLERIGRFTSSPSLHRTMTPPCGKRPSVSCITLPIQQDSTSTVMSSRGGESRVGIVDATLTPSESTLDFFVECQSRPETGVQEGMDWSRLPEEIKLSILRWLEPRELVRASAVSSEWHKLCFDGQLWQTLDASEFYNRIPVAQLAQLIVNTGPFVRKLNLRGCSQLTGDWRIESVANACRNLLAANLEGCKFQRKHIQFVILRNPSLVYLNLCGLKEVTNSVLKMVSQSCPGLKVLNVSHCKNADSTGLRRVMEKCTALNVLQANDMDMADDGFFTAVHRANTIEGLYLGQCTGITDEHIRLLTEGNDYEVDPFTNRSTAPPRVLKQLDLTKCQHLTDDALRYLAGTTPRLTSLILSNITQITDAGLTALLPNLPKLKTLDLEECIEITNTTLRNIARGPAAKRIQFLGISNCENVDDIGIIEVLRRCSSIRNFEMDNTRVTDLALVEAAHFVKKRAAAAAPVPGIIAEDLSKRISLRLVIFDCAGVTWGGVREIMEKNMEADPIKQSVIQMKCFFEYQKTVDQHTKHVVKGDVNQARFLLNEWVKYMEDSTGTDAGSRGRRASRRARNWAAQWAEDGDPLSRPRAGRGGSCAIM